MTWWNQSTLNIYAVHTSPYDISAYHFHIQHRYTDTAWVTKRVSLLNTKEQVWPLHGAAALSKLLPAKKIFRHHVTAFGKFGQTRRDYFCAVIQAKCKKKMLSDFHFINDKWTLKVPGHRTNRDSFFASRSLSTCSGITTLNEVQFRISFTFAFAQNPTEELVDQIEKE